MFWDNPRRWREALDGDGGADIAATDTIRNGWMKFRELFPFLTSRAPGWR